MDGSAYWTAVGAIAVAIIGVIGNKWIKAREEKRAEREITTSTAAVLAREREARPWSMLDGANDRLEDENERLVAENNRLRAERDSLTAKLDAARIEATDWQIEARKSAAALARVTELQQQCEQERLRHAEEIRGLREQIARLRRRRGDE